MAFWGYDGRMGSGLFVIIFLFFLFFPFKRVPEKEKRYS